MLRVNVIGSWACAKACARPMKAQRDGRIVNVASGVAFVAPAGTAHYNVSKAAVVGLTRTLARELGEYNVRVNSISPGLVWNESSRGQTSDEYGERMVQVRCLKRHMMPEDLVDTVLYLASDASRFVTGQNILVDGGTVFH
jgi:3-oxoacyl-[acyl-carrier protein] reductase